jgi:NAD(P)-dependent dehydrogenase (short-subunit alcohol dehydrogenase family)
LLERARHHVPQTTGPGSARGDAERWRERLKELPGHRAAEPEEIAYAAVFLSSDRSAYTSGAVLTIDGGISSRLAVL